MVGATIKGISASLVQALASHNLIDRYQLLLYPIALGKGKPLFKDFTKLKLVNTMARPSGIVELHYQPKRAGKRSIVNTPYA